MRRAAMVLVGMCMGLMSCAEGTATHPTSSSGAAGGSGGEAGGGGVGGTGGGAVAGAGGMGGEGGASGGGMAGEGGGPECGNGILDDGEACDASTDKTCEDLGYTGGPLTCKADCTLDVSTCSSCGDGVIQLALGEDCDFDAQGDPLVTATCQSLGFPMSGANPGCNANCEHDMRICKCGDGQRDMDEPCDGADLGGKTCVTEGFGSGTLVCSPDCDLDTSGCSLCGNGMVDVGESCDGMNLDGKTCITEGFGKGVLGCTSCMLDTSMCDPCGNAIINVGESCDGQNLGGQNCLTQGFGGGQLACSSTCAFDTTNCNPCGNQIIDVGEMCDGGSLGGQTCVTQGFGSGQLGCSPMCTFDTSGCDPCGNGVIDGTEACDEMNLNGQTCTNLGFSGGQLACTSTCTFDTSGCSVCGDGTIDPGEACDGVNLGGKTCQTQGFGGGTLSCTSTCMLDTGNCSLCGNGMLNAGEDCDDGNTTSGDGCSATCQIEVMICDPDGTYTIVGAPVSYTCCFGLVSVNVSSFVFTNNGAIIGSSPSNPVPMTGNATTCPSGSFSNQGSIPGGCAETYKLVGSFTGQNTWTGTYELQFQGPDCSCFGGLDTPCVNQLFSITAQR